MAKYVQLKFIGNTEINMLETPEERVELLRAGISGKRIEELYISGNGFIIKHPVLLSGTHKKRGIYPEK